MPIEELQTAANKAKSIPFILKVKTEKYLELHIAEKIVLNISV